MALYGSVDSAKVLLKAAPNTVFSTDVDARLAALQAVVSSYIEYETGRAFGGGPATATGVVVEAPVSYVYDVPVNASTVLFLPKAIRTITAVYFDPEWSGTAWSGGTLVPATEYVPVLPAYDTYGGLASVAGDAWAGRYLVVGTWEDTDADSSVPVDITYVANYLIAEAFKAEQTSAAAMAGPDGSTLPLKNPYKNPLVVGVLEKYRTTVGSVVI